MRFGWMRFGLGLIRSVGGVGIRITICIIIRIRVDVCRVGVFCCSGCKRANLL